MAKKALIVWGGWDGHTPRQCAELFAPWLQSKGFEVEVSTTLDSYLDKAKIEALSLVVPIWTMGQISGEQEKGLLDAIAAGVGVAGFHGGMCDSFRNNTNYQWMTGGQWVAHPGGCIPEYTVNITDRTHAITKGIKDFKLVNTEQYYLHTDPSNHVLATTRSRTAMWSCPRCGHGCGARAASSTPPTATPTRTSPSPRPSPSSSAACSGPAADPGRQGLAPRGTCGDATPPLRQRGNPAARQGSCAAPPPRHPVAAVRQTVTARHATVRSASSARKRRRTCSHPSGVA